MSGIDAGLADALADRYAFEGEIGRGGMATVYLAKDLRHERKVALKVLRPELAAVVGSERFLAEIKTTANLQHPNILPLFDSGEAAGQLFYVMPYVEGESLRDRLERERQLPVDEAVGIATEVAEALQEAHDQGVVHRDVKPANILVRKGKPLVADFGIALALSSAGGGRLTETGLSLGTPYYMSPEQASGDQVLTPATDTYSLGCMLYEMLTGDPPFPGSTAQAVLANILTGDPRGVIEQRRAVPPNVEAAVLKAIEKVPADRFRSVRDFARALADPGFRHGTPVPVSERATTWKRAAVGASALAAGLAVALTLSLVGGDAPQPRFLSMSPPAPLDSVEASLAPTGDKILYHLRGDQGLWLDDFTLGAPRRLDVVSEGLNRVSFSPDGRRIAVQSRSEGLRILDLTGRASITVADTLRVGGEILWAEDAFVYFSTNWGTVARIPVDGGVIDTVTSYQEDRWAYGLDVLPGGRGLLYGLGSFVGAEPSEVQVLDLETGQSRALVDAVKATYARSGHLVFIRRDGTAWAAPFDLDALEMTGPAVEILSGIAVGGFRAHFDLSPSGSLLYMTGSAPSGAPRKVVWRDRSGAVLPDDPGLPSGPGHFFSAFRLSPDGSKLAVTVSTDGETELYVKELGGGPALVLADSAYATSWLDDETVLFSSGSPEDEGVLFMRPADGSRPAELVLAEEDHDVRSGLRSPDGEWLVYFSDRRLLGRRRGADTAVVLVGAEEEPVAPSLSPDGHWLAYESGGEVFVRPFPEVSARRIPVSIDGGRQPRWSDAGDELFYLESRAPGRRMWSARFSTESDFEVVGRTVLYSYFQNISVGFADGSEYDVSADGQRFVGVEYPPSNPELQGLRLVENFSTLLEERLAAGR